MSPRMRVGTVARRRFPSHTGSRRVTQWIGPADQGYVSVASGGATLIASTSFEDSTTVVRTRGHTSIQPGSFAADLNVIGAVGMAIVSAEALAAGITSIPEPFNDADWGGWLVWRSFSLHLDVATAAGFDSNAALEFELDSKAMRKITPNEALVIVAESQAGAFDISTPWRVLVKLT